MRGRVLALLGGVLASCQQESGEDRADLEPSAARETAASGELAVIPSRSAVLEEWRRHADDPEADGWTTEVLAAVAEEQLSRLGELLLASDAESAAEEILALLETEEALGQVVPANLERVFEDGPITVDRVQRAPLWEKSPGGIIGELVKVGPGPGDPEAGQFKAKIVEVKEEGTGQGFVTRQRVALNWRTASTIVEQHATWRVHWASRGGERAPLIRRLEVGDFEETRTRRAEGRTLFADCTGAVFGEAVSYREQLMRGLNHWLERIPYRVPMNFSSAPGVALGDVDGDGLDDLYLCQEPGLPNRLFLQNPDGTLRDVSSAWGVDWIEDSRSALLADFDNDGDQDLALAVYGGVVLASNEAGVRFRLHDVLPTTRSTTSMVAADFDRDGRLDLYVCAYAPDGSPSEPAQLGALANRFVFHDANDGAANTLFRNQSESAGQLQFSDVTREMGLEMNHRRWSFAACWEDYDNDGDPDLYVANDFGRNNLYRNDGLDGGVGFTDVAAELGVEDSASGMSTAWGDFNRDGWMDVYVSNMFSAAGSRITSQSRFKPGLSESLRRRFQHFARGNTLLQNLGEAGFRDVSEPAGVTLGRWAWGSNFVDLNNDGWEDLVVANGNVTADDTGDL